MKGFIVIIGNYNIFQIRIYLEVLQSKEERLKYLYTIKKEIRNIILKFNDSTLVPLRTYADSPYMIDDCSPELSIFVKEMILKYSVDPGDRRSPCEDFLRRMVQNEIRNYEKFEEFLDIELDDVMGESKVIAG